MKNHSTSSATFVNDLNVRVANESLWPVAISITSLAAWLKSRGAFSVTGFQRNPLIKTTQDRGHMIDQTTAFPKLKAHASPHTPDRHQIWNISVRHPAATYAHSNLRVMLIWLIIGQS
jgi:hypothetical protein